MSEFDDYAQKGYDELIDDPIKQGLCGSSDYFLNQKIDLLKKTILKETKPQRHLDLGCGEGNLCHKLQDELPFSMGIEISKGMLQGSRSPVALYDGKEIPFSDNSFDLVTCACVYHHVPVQEREKFSSEVLRILKPGGSFIIFEHNPYNPLTQWIVSRTPVDEHAVLLKASEFKQTHLKEFVDHQHKYYLFFPKKLDRLESLFEPILSKLPLGGQYLYWAKKK